jgi:septal ring factor EnvC (AmiA/AmiB activator)
MDSYRIPTVIAVIVIAVVVASAAIVTVSQRDQADAATARTEQAEAALAAAQDELTDVQGELAYTTGNLRTVSREVTQVSRTLIAAEDRADELADQNRACRYLVRVNDGLLYGMVAQQHATGQLMQGHEKVARTAVQRAARHVQFVERVVERSGNRSISGLVLDCAPPVSSSGSPSR